TKRLEYKKSEMLDKDFTFFVAEEDRRNARKNIKVRFQDIYSGSNTYKLRKKNGDYLTASFNTLPRKKEGNFAGLIGGGVDISLETELRLKLHESEEQFKNFFYHSAIGIYRTTPEGEIIFANPALVKLMGYNSFAELSTKNLNEIDRKQNFKREEFIKLIEKDGFVTGYETIWKREDGNIIFIRESAVLVKDKNDNPLYYDGTIEDITSEKKKEKIIEKQFEKLKREHYLLKKAEELGQVGTWLLNIKTGEVEISDSLMELFKLPVKATYSLEEFHQCIHPDDLGARLDFIKNLDSLKNHSFNSNYRLLINNKIIWISAIGEILLNENNEPEYIVAALQDITKRKEELIALQERAAIIDSSEAIIIGKDLNGTIKLWNKGAERIFGYKADEVIGENISIIVPRGLKKELKTLNNKIASGQKVENFETTRICRDGRLVDVKISLSPVHDEEGRIVGISTVGQDITTQKQLEQELTKAKEKAEEANRAKSLFLANISHEIRTPLNSILGFSEIMSRRTTDSTQKSYLQSVLTSSNILLSLINNVLDFTKAQSNKLIINNSFCDIRYVLHEIESIFRLKASQKLLDFSISCSPSVPKFLCVDELRIRQILLNLTSNAIKFTDKGAVMLKIWTENKIESTVDLILEVKDTGKGIPARFHEKIFKIFEQENSEITHKYGGTGLGLAITTELTKLMNGHIELKSKEGKGSTFKVVFPFTKYSETTGEEHKVPAQINSDLVNFEPATMLIVDDTVDNIEVIKGMLEMQPFKILEAHNGKEALKLLEQNNVNFIFMDIKMPGMDGIEAVNKIREREEWSHIPVVALSASSAGFNKIKLITEGFNDALRKPVKMDEVINVLAKHISHKLLEGEMNRQIELSDNFDCNQLSELIDSLETNALPVYEELKKIRPRKKVELFAKLIFETGEKFKCSVVQKYGRDLQDAHKKIKIGKEKNLINDFPLFIQKLKNYYNEYNSKKEE
ncbi:MAG: PAS domain S-box protein, partial [Prolixibacteraceae bacterium]|nr:PAS domain S-box protein [Prolixibacteraceae bacterium]